MNGKAGVVLGAALATAMANGTPADHYTADGLAAETAKLKAQAAETGSAGITLARYANHFTMLSYRNRNGGGELHRQYADMFYVVQGKATLLSEGSLPDAKEESPGEWRGTAVAGGKETPLKQGDIVNIPAGTPHQLLVAPGEEFLYFVIKVKEAE